MPAPVELPLREQEPDAQSEQAAEPEDSGSETSEPAAYRVHAGTIPLPPVVKLAFSDDLFENIRQERQEKLQLLADYASGRLQEDIQHGMEVDISKLWKILDAIHQIKEGDIR